MCSRICPCKEDYKMYYTGNMTDEGDRILRKSNRSSSLDFMTSAEIDDYQKNKELAEIVPLVFTKTEISYEVYDRCYDNSFKYYLEEEKQRSLKNNIPFNQMLVYSETFFKSGAYTFLHALETQNLREGGCGSICYKVPFFRLKIQWHNTYVGVHSNKTALLTANNTGLFSGRKIEYLNLDITCTDFYLRIVNSTIVSSYDGFNYTLKKKKVQIIYVFGILLLIGTQLIIVSSIPFATDFRLKMVNRDYIRYLLNLQK